MESVKPQPSSPKNTTAAAPSPDASAGLPFKQFCVR